MFSDIIANNNITLIIVSVTTCVNAVAAVSTLYLTRKVEKATNSMKDDLVAATRSSALQEGHTEGVSAQKASQAILDSKTING